MASDLRSSLREAAFQSFEAEFTRNGYSVPEGLIRLLREFTLKNREEPDEARSRFYKRLWALLWFGSDETLGGDVPRGKPTYVFPETLKNVVREIIPGALVDRPDPTHMNVYKVNIGDLAVAKWPAVKKKKKSH